MRLTLLMLTAAALLPSAGCTGKIADASMSRSRLTLDYPETRTVNQVDRYHGFEVADPYRWLEEDTDETRAWIEAQDGLLEGYVEGVEGFEGLRQRLLEVRKFDRFGIPQRRGERLFFIKISAGAQQGALYAQQGVLGESRRILDFSEVIEDPSHRVSGFAVSHDGQHVVWASLAPSGWGWLDLAGVSDGQRRSERIMGVAGASAIWTHDSRGFFYLEYGDVSELEAGTAEPRTTLRYHALGTDPDDDPIIYQREDRPSMLFSPKLSDDGRYLVLGLNDGTSSRNDVVYKDLNSETSDFVPLISGIDASFIFEGNVGSRFFFQTDHEAPRGRLISVDLKSPQPEFWADVVPERAAPLTGISHVGGRLVVRFALHARPVVEIWKYDGTRERELELPAIGLLAGFPDDVDGSVSFFRLNSLHDPGTTYRVDLETGKSEVHQRPELAHNPDDYEIRQVFYESKDGVRIPMFLAHRKDVPLRSRRELNLYGYGHGGWVAFPWFQPHLISWMDMGGTYALPGLRGGGEYGTEWQEAGTLLNKPNTIDDYIAAAEWLIEHEYTTADRLVANGGSASGVVPAAAVIRRPDLFGAAVIDFPFLDMLRYHHFTPVAGWTQGYGSSEVAEQFEVLFSYSPVHNLKRDQCYPAMLTIVAEEDTATVPMHGYKFIAAFQAVQGCDRPGLLKFIPGAGHYSYGRSPEDIATTEAQILAFLIRTLGMGRGAA